MKYNDFKIRFLKPYTAQDGGEVFPISAESPSGNDQGEFVIPFSTDALEEQLVECGLVTRSASPEMAQVNNERISTTMHDLGRQLFNAIFGNKNIGELYLKNLSKIQEHTDLGLRIKLCINPEYHELARLMNLPWEYMLDTTEKKDFLGLFETLPIVRFLDLKRPMGPIKVEKLPLKILVMIASPAGYPKLDVEEEKKLLLEAFANRKEIQIDFIEKATLLALKDQLSENSYHIFHYIGHGGFDGKTGKGVLVLEDDDGNSVLVAGEKLKRVFRDSSIGIIFLNACETARMSAEKDPFAGIASSLMIENIFAVVAMQFPISDVSAIVFSKKFYTSLAQGNPIDQAVSRSRQAVDLCANETLEWGIPVLFMRSEDGVVFELKEAAKPDEPRLEEPKNVSKATRSGVSVEKEKPIFLFCIKCGERLIPGSTFCRKCGEMIE